MKNVYKNLKTYFGEVFKKLNRTFTSKKPAVAARIENNEYLTQKNAAKIYDICIPTLTKYMRMGIVPFVIVNGRNRLRIVDVINATGKVKFRKHQMKFRKHERK